MIKELWILIKMLFATKPSDMIGQGLEVVEMNHFPFEGYKAMSWCGRIIHRKGASAVSAKTMSHEKIHLMQAMMCGSWFSYYWKYFVEWLKGNPITKPSSSAYMTIPFECEAYANEDNMDYCKDYDGSNLPKYTFKSRKKLYKQLGGTSKAWKQYVKTI